MYDYPKAWQGIGAAILGTALICFGSRIVYLCPTDGQTMMITGPAWITGATLGIIAIVLCFKKEVPKPGIVFIGLCALVAIGSVIAAFISTSSA